MRHPRRHRAKNNSLLKGGRRIECKTERKNQRVALCRASDHRDRPDAQHLCDPDGAGKRSHVPDGSPDADRWHGLFPARCRDGDDAARRRRWRADLQNEKTAYSPADRVSHGCHHYRVGAGSAGPCGAGAVCAEHGVDHDGGCRRGAVSGAGHRAYPL